MTTDRPVLAGIVLEVEDITRSIAFYRNVVGLGLVNRMEWEGYRLAYFESGEQELTLVQNPPEDADEVAPRASGVMLHFNAEGLDEQFHRITRAWKRVVMEVGDSPWGGRQFVVADPDGYNLMFTGA